MTDLTCSLAVLLTEAPPPDLTLHPLGFAAIGVFVLAYALVMSEEVTHLRKSKPVILAAGILWILVAVAYAGAGTSASAPALIRHEILAFAELFLFLLAAMTYVNTMEERQVFDVLRAWLVRRRLSFRALFWITGVLSFFLSGLIDNLTTALVMGSVCITVGRGHPRFVGVACVNVVVAANAGGAFSPFGDVTTLMVWQAGVISFWEFFGLFVPSVVNWLVPALVMVWAVPRAYPDAAGLDVRLRPGAFFVIALFALTIGLTVAVHNFFHLPPVLGMMTGLGFLNLYSYFLKLRARHAAGKLLDEDPAAPLAAIEPDPSQKDTFDIFHILANAEWDTLMFFYGITLCVGALGAFGYLVVVNTSLYGGLGATWANIAVGLLSSVVDNIPVMYTVLKMRPEMGHSQWLLVTLTAGVGGSLLSVGSAAGVALMGQARGVYTFLSHLRWTWAIALGYAASIALHLWIHGS